MNLLGMPMRPAAPASGVVCVDSARWPLPAPLPAGSAQFALGPVNFTSTTDLQPTPLELTALIKAKYRENDSAAQARLLNLLKTLYNIDQPTPFTTQSAFQNGVLDLSNSVDDQVWLALTLPSALAKSLQMTDLRAALADLSAKGIALSIGLAPPGDLPGSDFFNQGGSLPKRNILWRLVTKDETGAPVQIPLTVVADTSDGGRTPGVTLLRLPSDANLLTPPVTNGDPMYAGAAAAPPQLPNGLTQDQVVLWLTLTTADPSGLALGWLGINATAITALTPVPNEVLGVADGTGDALFRLAHAPVDPSSLVLEVWPAGASQGQSWRAISNFGQAGPRDQVFVLDATAGTVTFGDGVRGLRPTAGATIVAQAYSYGGGSNGNLPAGSLKAVTPNAGTVRQEIATSGGSDGETVPEAERRIPAFLANRERAVTAGDFQALALATPGLSLGRAEVVQGLMPGAEAAATRPNVPGVVSVFVWPDQQMALGAAPVAKLEQLRRVFAFLRQRALIGTQLFVLAAVPIDIHIGVSIKLRNGLDQLAAIQAMQQTLVSYLWPLPPGGVDGAGWPLGRNVAMDEIRTEAGRAAGVLAVDGVTLHRRDSGVWSNPVDPVGLKAWEVPRLYSIGVAFDGADPPAPEDAGTAPAAGGSSGLVPVVPSVC
jgi:predicted phage baseplate assembly protein